MSGTLSCVSARLVVVAKNPLSRNTPLNKVFSGSLGIFTSFVSSTGISKAMESALTTSSVTSCSSYISGGFAGSRAALKVIKT